MAKIKYSALVTGMRNKLNGSVASRNRYGDYWRNKTTPVNPRSNFQQNVRAMMAANSRTWRSLPPEARASWNNAAPSRPFTDIWGDKLIYSGFNLFMKVNQMLLNYGLAVMATAPPNEPSPIDIGGIAVSATGGLVTIQPTVEPPIPQKLIVYAAANYSAGKSYTKNLQKFIVALDDTTTYPYDITPLIQQRFGLLTSGTGITVRAAAFEPQSALLGIPYQASVLVP